jgi:type IV secretory pathway protease TraF
MGFNLEDYEPVQSRYARFITWAATQENFYSVISEMLSAPGADICVFKTSIICDGVLVSTGHAEEVRGAGNVNRTSHVENCETSSLGRCLANFPKQNFAGSDVNKRPSREEMSKAASRGYLPRSTTAFPDSKTVHLPPSHPESIASANGVKVRGIQHGALPDWLVIEAVQAGVTEVYDNRADVLDNPKRPWFKATTGGKDAKAFWAPKGTPLPVIAMHEDDLEDDISQEEPF